MCESRKNKGANSVSGATFCSSTDVDATSAQYERSVACSGGWRMVQSILTLIHDQLKSGPASLERHTAPLCTWITLNKGT